MSLIKSKYILNIMLIVLIVITIKSSIMFILLTVCHYCERNGQCVEQKGPSCQYFSAFLAWTRSKPYKEYIYKNQSDCEV